ncbi:Kinesin-like protein a [Operophtera brumata]|uniref:Kinesin-like protein a n=1 Tax=Operophtera brumata TaxID=104452 RepID=A0A0L7LPB6_OPEBR|nr:Kinesin-like protein a [Operophtera brumata]
MIREYTNSIEFRPLTGHEQVEDHQITVCVRKRPLNKKEMNKKEVDVISVPTKDQMIVHEPKNKYKPLNLIVSASFFEIYSGKVFDLLADKAKLRVLEDGKQQVQIVGLTEKVVDNVDEFSLIDLAGNERGADTSSANRQTSEYMPSRLRVVQIIVRSPGMHRVHGKFSLIDLAGYERGADTSSANRQTRVHPRARHEGQQPPAVPRVQADAGAARLVHRREVAHLHDRHDLAHHVLVRALAQHAAIRRQEGDMSAEMYNFHEAIDEMQRAEEEVLDNHKAISDYMAHALQRTAQLMQLTRDVDYDQEAYATQWEELLNEQLAVLAQSRDLVAEFRSKMQQEEHISRRIQPRHH